MELLVLTRESRLGFRTSITTLRGELVVVRLVIVFKSFEEFLPVLRQCVININDS